MNRQLITIWLVLFLVGCGVLNPAGPYAGDRVLYEADNTIVSAYQVFDQFLQWEKQNRDMLFKISPEIKHSADNVREHSPQWISSAIVVRNAYKATPDATTRSKLDSALSVLREAVNQAISYMATTKAKG